MTKPKTSLSMIVVLLRVLSLFSFIGFVSGFLMLIFVLAAGADWKRSFDSVEFPLPNVPNVVVDAEDRVLVNVASYGRVQIYDQTGKFLRGFFSIAPMEPSLIGFDDHDNIIVVANRSNSMVVFDNDGSLLQRNMGGRKTAVEWRKNPQWTRDSAGREYLVRNKWLSPQVYRVLATGEEEVFLSTPFCLWPFVAPVPCLISLLFSQLVLKLLQRRNKRMAID